LILDQSPTARIADSDPMPTDLQTILRLSVPVIVQVGERFLPMDDVLALGPGAILELTKSSEDELELLVNNKVIAKGVAVKVGENFGIRITTIGSPTERVTAMGN
jgi:flagellar motor switch protein FliN/FliY